jgi:hypothetical protein
MDMLRWCPMSWEAEKDWSVMVGILTFRHYAVCHNIQLPSFSASHDIGHHLSIGLPDDGLLKCRNM